MLWYDPASLPAGQLHVRLYWVGHGTARLFEAARIWQRASKSWQWYAMINGQPSPLPPRRELRQWSPQPLCWQPLEAGVWSWPGAAPKPLAPHMVPQMAVERQRFGAVEAATAAELAREMERDRDDARRGAIVDDAVDTYRRWWRDITIIKYQPAGEVSLAMAEGRVMRAMAWAGAYDLMAPVSKVTAQILAAYASDDLATQAADDTQIVKFRPLPQDHDDFQTAMSWVVALNPPELWSDQRRAWSLSRSQRVLYWRAKNTPLSLREIADGLSRDESGRLKGKPISWQAVQQTYVRAIEQVWRAANGERVHKHVRVVDRMEAVRQGNWQYRNGGKSEIL